MVVSSRRLGIAARYRAGMIGLRTTVRDAAKSLLRPRSASKKPKATVTKGKAGKRLRKSPRLGKR
jgi:hypothetical protein